MLDAIIRGSLRHRGAVLGAAAVLLVAGAVVAARLPVDVFPDLTAPTVTVITEARGMAPEEVELLVTFPVESSLNGAPGVRRIRSVSGPGIAVVWVEFEWGEDVYRARQVVAERLQGVEPARAASSARPSVRSARSWARSRSSPSPPTRWRPMELRRLGGDRRAPQPPRPARRSRRWCRSAATCASTAVELDPAALAQAAALRRRRRRGARGGERGPGRRLPRRRRPGVPRARARPRPLDARDLRGHGAPRPRTGSRCGSAQIATVREAAEPARGTASYRARPAVILTVQKQPGANTLELTRRIDARPRGPRRGRCPTGVVIEKENFRQADFIDVAIRNVRVALRDGAVLVLVILFLFLGNLRATLISAVAIPLSLVAGVLVLSALRRHPQHDDARRLHDRDRGARGRRDHRRRERLPAAAPGAGEARRRAPGRARRGLPGLVRGAGRHPVRDAGHRPRLPAPPRAARPRGAAPAAARPRLPRLARRLARRGPDRDARSSATSS